jgi:phage terminase small subunit
MGNILAKDELIKEKYLPALEIYAEAQSQFQFAITEIKKANQDKFGSGYFQKFTSGAMNISVYVTLKEKAEDSILKCCKLFGLDPKSEKELKLDTGQMDLFQELLKQKHA